MPVSSAAKYGVVSYRNSTSNHNSWRMEYQRNIVVSYRNSTSNHNFAGCSSRLLSLYLIEILHQTTTYRTRGMRKSALYLIEILHQTTTFRLAAIGSISCILSKFYIKPQLCEFGTLHGRVVSYRNSTSNHNCSCGYRLRSLVVSYRNSTSNHNTMHPRKFYLQVVSYRNSTSNHNVGPHID